MALTPSHTVERVAEAPAARLSSLDAYWSHYLAQHRHPASRVLHFVGTSAFFVAIGASVVANPVVFPAAMAVVVGLAWWASSHTEQERPAFAALLAMIVVAMIASPLYMPLGVAVAYACAWIGHFRIEHNRPATFKYPVWSVLSDFRMWGEMVRGHLWTGDPLDELGLVIPGEDLPA